MIQPKVVITGYGQLDEALSYMHVVQANKIANACIAAGSRRAAVGIRKKIKRSIRPRTLDKGIGWRMKKGTKKNVADGKAGVAVGRAFRAPLRRQGPRVLWQAKKKKMSKRKGAGVTAANLHWFALGTKKRYTKVAPPTSIFGMARSKLGFGPKGRYTGSISKAKYGGFVRAIDEQDVQRRMFVVAQRQLLAAGKKSDGAKEALGVLGGY